MTNEGDAVQVEGLHISSHETESVNWYEKTTQPVPRQLMAFEFSATIAKMDQFLVNTFNNVRESYDFVGLVSGCKELRKELRY